MPDAPTDQVIYDDAAYHQGAPAFLTQHLSAENSGTHIGIYLGWIIQTRLESFSLRLSAAAAVEEVRSKQMSGRDFLFAHCNGRLTSGALNQEAQAFTHSYYDDLYLHDYDEVLVSKAGGTYLVVDSWANFERLAAVIDRRLAEYRGRSGS